MKIFLFLLSFVLIGLSSCANKGFGKVFENQEQEYVSTDTVDYQSQSGVLDLYSCSLLPLDDDAPPKSRKAFVITEFKSNGKDFDPSNRYRRARDGLIRGLDESNGKDLDPSVEYRRARDGLIRGLDKNK